MLNEKNGLPVYGAVNFPVFVKQFRVTANVHGFLIVQVRDWDLRFQWIDEKDWTLNIVGFIFYFFWILIVI